MKTIRSAASLLAVALLGAAVLLGCDSFGLFGGGTGTVSLSLTDAPIADAADVEGVFITIASIAYNVNDEWVEAEGFVGPREFNLLDLTGGEVAPLGNTVLSAGEINQIRFMLTAQEQDAAGEQSDGTEGCYIVFDPDGVADGVDDGDTIVPLFVPSGSENGYKATGSFVVPVNGTVEITADFDVRKSVVVAGARNSGTGDSFYLLKPTIKLIVNDQAGAIAGEFVEPATVSDSYVVFVYEDDVYDASEATAADDQSAPFPNAITSGNAVDSDDDAAIDSYTIPFVAAGTYDLVIAGVNAEGDYTVLDTETYVDITVASEETTTADIDLSPATTE